MQELIRRCPECSTFVTALTGIAATHLPRGTTLHSFAGVGLAKGSREDCLQHVQRSSKARSNWQKVQVLIVDEASMMSKALFEKLEFVARKMKGKDQLPFGGVTLVLCGDFFQLPPVSRGGATADDARFCFESEAWGRCLRAATGGPENTFSLNEVFRQKDGRLLQLLSEVRHNSLTQQGLRTLEDLRRELGVQDGVEPTKLYPANARVDAVNRQKLAALEGGPGREATFEAADTIPEGYYVPTEKLDEMFKLPRRVELKVGAQVVLLRNSSQTLVNGSRGVVVSLSPDPEVRFLSGETKVVGREKEEFDVMGPGGVRQAVRHQVPLRLSWAMTIHKSQGMSIDLLEVDLRDVFEAGQAYVALSRARTLEGLRVLGYDPSRFWTNPKVIEFYRTRVLPA